LESNITTFILGKVLQGRGEVLPTRYIPFLYESVFGNKALTFPQNIDARPAARY